LSLRTKILKLLRCHPDVYVSGEMISKQLFVSRTAIWKHIQAIKQAGYAIESHPRKGYCLRHVPDLLIPEEVVANLETSWLGQDISYFASIGSTNDEAKKMAANGKATGAIVLAEKQILGRGRMAREWFSPDGAGIWLSVILRPNLLPKDAPKITLLAAVAVNRAIIKCTGLATGIKWPNDIVFQDKKIAGILTEMNSEMDAINYIVLGIGINVNVKLDEFPTEVQTIASSLSMLTGHSISRVQLLAEILLQLEQLYEEACRDGFAHAFSEWRRMTITLGQLIDVISPEQSFSGAAIDIDENGALLVDTNHGLVSVLAGDIKVRLRQEGGL